MMLRIALPTMNVDAILTAGASTSPDGSTAGGSASGGSAGQDASGAGPADQSADQGAAQSAGQPNTGTGPADGSADQGASAGDCMIFHAPVRHQYPCLSDRRDVDIQLGSTGYGGAGQMAGQKANRGRGCFTLPTYSDVHGALSNRVSDNIDE